MDILMILNFIANVNNGLSVFLSVLAILATVGVGFLLFRFERKERRRYKEEVANFIEGVESKREITAEVNSYIAKATTKEFAMIYIDIDKFSRIVETIGKDESNNIVKAIAAKIITILPVRVSIGRYGPDRFVIFIKSEYTKDDTVKLARQIIEVINQPLKLYGDATLSVSASLGICFYPAHGRSFKQLSESLELACYQAKKDGGNKYRIYVHESNESQNLEYYNQIKEGIRSHQFDLYFQPMIDGAKEDIYAIEGLLRWNHPELGVLSPYKFISIMEQTGDINWVGLWGMETLMKEFIRLKKKYNREFKMSLNLSPKQLTNKTLAMDFQKLVKKYHISPKMIILEIEEFAIFDRQEQIKENLKALKDLGFDIAVDGFGLDYKALKKLEESSINVLKLDKEYLSGQSDASLKEKFIEILVDFASNHSLTLVAEGVEDYNYLERARSMGCELYQGYFFAKPMDRESLDNFITDTPWIDKLHGKNLEEAKPVEEVKETKEEEKKEDSMEEVKEEVKTDAEFKEDAKEETETITDSIEKIQEDKQVEEAQEDKKDDTQA